MLSELQNECNINDVIHHGLLLILPVCRVARVHRQLLG